MSAPAGTDARVKELRESAQKLLALDHFGALGVSRTATPDEVKQLRRMKSNNHDLISTVPYLTGDRQAFLCTVFDLLDALEAAWKDRDQAYEVIRRVNGVDWGAIGRAKTVVLSNNDKDLKP